MERYSRQSVFSEIGLDGQKKLLQSRVVIIGMCALGTVAANNLCRAGVGYIRLVDRDYVELSNLQRQILFNEDDARNKLPKAAAAVNHLSKVNSEITLEPVITDVNSGNIEKIISGVDLVLDATDNFEIRRLINEACCKLQIPWIYCGALGSQGMTMNFTQDENTPCLRCFMGEKVASHDTCSSFGVLNMLTSTMASIQTAEAVKILLGAKTIRKNLLTLDLWSSEFSTITITKDPNCPVCVHNKYEYLGKNIGSYSTSICATDSIQIMPPRPVEVNFTVMEERLAKSGTVKNNGFALIFSNGTHEIILFRDGRAMIKNAIDENNAKSIYTEYIGL